jgi:hypothetical protein
MPNLDIVTIDPITGRETGLSQSVQRVIKALKNCQYCIVDAIALAVRGLPHMTREIGVVVLSDDAERAISALRKAGFQPVAPPGYSDEADPMVVFEDPKTRMEVDLLIAAGNPEALVISTASRARVFGAIAPVASLEQLLLLYLYSNQPKHLGDFASIVQSGRANLARSEQMLAEIHPQMLKDFRKRVNACLHLAPAPKKPRGRA